MATNFHSSGLAALHDRHRLAGMDAIWRNRVAVQVANGSNWWMMSEICLSWVDAFQLLVSHSFALTYFGMSCRRARSRRIPWPPGWSRRRRIGARRCRPPWCRRWWRRAPPPWACRTWDWRWPSRRSRWCGRWHGCRSRSCTRRRSRARSRRRRSASSALRSCWANSRWGRPGRPPSRWRWSFDASTPPIAHYEITNKSIHVSTTQHKRVRGWRTMTMTRMMLTRCRTSWDRAWATTARICASDDAPRPPGADRARSPSGPSRALASPRLSCDS